MRRTRARIVEVAETLFEERGYDETTIAEIAAEADVSPATVYNYFASKDDILFADYEAIRVALAERLASRPEGTSTIDAMREWYTSGRRELRSVESDYLHRRIIDASPTLRAQERLRMSYFERVLAVEVGHDLGEPPEGLRPRLVAAALAAVYLATMQHGVEHGTPNADPFAQLDHAHAFVEAGFEAIRSLPPPHA
jgi:AcrR family transcriptional regulator